LVEAVAMQVQEVMVEVAALAVVAEVAAVEPLVVAREVLEEVEEVVVMEVAVQMVVVAVLEVPVAWQKVERSIILDKHLVLRQIHFLATLQAAQREELVDMAEVATAVALEATVAEEAVAVAVCRWVVVAVVAAAVMVAPEAREERPVVEETAETQMAELYLQFLQSRILVTHSLLIV
jgi:hypothetical protein